MDWSPFFLAFLLCGIAVAYYDDTPFYQPDQVHISTGSSDNMIIVWNTQNYTNVSTVVYGTDQHDLKAQVNGTVTKFVDGGSAKRIQYIHEVNVTGLKPDTVYYYMVGCWYYGYSPIYSFKTWPAGVKWSPRVAFFGDMGKVNAKSVPRLENDVMNGKYDAILHVGDIAYFLHQDNGHVGDDFMRMIQPLATSVPYLTCSGNHEVTYNFSNYKNRFRNPGDIDQRMYYSFKMGPIRFISTATEYVFFPQYGVIQIARHYDWLEKELKDANLPENRAKQPWVITYGHKPMYCSNNDADDCTKAESLIRTGIPPLGVFGWEKPFYENGVDVAIWAHEHSYERLWPVYNRKVMNGSSEHPYTNPKAPVHIITGSAGCCDGHDGFRKNPQPWSAFRAEDYGYSRMQVFNSTHLVVEQVSDDKDGKVIDSIWVVKDKHGSYQHDPSPVKPVGDVEKLVKKFLERMKKGKK